MSKGTLLVVHSLSTALIFSDMPDVHLLRCALWRLRELRREARGHMSVGASPSFSSREQALAVELVAGGHRALAASAVLAPLPL